MSYADLLRNPRWQRRRLEIMQRANFACELCGDNNTTLNVHHLRYVRGRKPWEYGDDELACLCEPCHEFQHSEIEARKKERERADRERAHEERQRREMPEAIAAWDALTDDERISFRALQDIDGELKRCAGDTTRIPMLCERKVKIAGELRSDAARRWQVLARRGWRFVG